MVEDGRCTSMNQLAMYRFSEPHSNYKWRDYDIFYVVLLGVAPFQQQWPPGLLHVFVGDSYKPSFAISILAGPKSTPKLSLGIPKRH